MRHCALNSNRADDQPVKLAKVGQKPILGDKLEQQFVDYALTMEARLFGLTRRDLQRTSYQLLVNIMLDIHFTTNNEIVGGLICFTIVIKTR